MKKCKHGLELHYGCDQKESVLTQGFSLPKEILELDTLKDDLINWHRKNAGFLLDPEWKSESLAQHLFGLGYRKSHHPQQEG